MRGEISVTTERRLELEILRGSLMLQDLPEEELKRLALMLRRRTYRRGEVIFHLGDPGQTLHVVCQGHVKIVLPTESGEEAVLSILGPGELFGEMALLDGAPRSATVVALEPVETATLSRQDFLVLLRSSPAAVEGLLASLARAVRRLSDEVTGLMFADLRGRLVRKLLELAEAHGREHDGALEIQVPLTQEELAGMIGATRPRVNRLLGFFEDRGVIARSGRRIAILNRELLERWAGV